MELDFRRCNEMRQALHERFLSGIERATERAFADDTLLEGNHCLKMNWLHTIYYLNDRLCHLRKAAEAAEGIYFPDYFHVYVPMNGSGDIPAFAKSEAAEANRRIWALYEKALDRKTLAEELDSEGDSDSTPTELPEQLPDALQSTLAGMTEALPRCTACTLLDALTKLLYELTREFSRMQYSEAFTREYAPAAIAQFHLFLEKPVDYSPHLADWAKRQHLLPTALTDDDRRRFADDEYHRLYAALEQHPAAPLWTACWTADGVDEDALFRAFYHHTDALEILTLHRDLCHFDPMRKATDDAPAAATEAPTSVEAPTPAAAHPYLKPQTDPVAWKRRVAAAYDALNRPQGKQRAMPFFAAVYAHFCLTGEAYDPGSMQDFALQLEELAEAAGVRQGTLRRWIGDYFKDLKDTEVQFKYVKETVLESFNGYYEQVVAALENNSFSKYS